MHSSGPCSILDCYASDNVIVCDAKHCHWVNGIRSTCLPTMDPVCVAIDCCLGSCHARVMVETKWCQHTVVNAALS